MQKNLQFVRFRSRHGGYHHKAITRVNNINRELSFLVIFMPVGRDRSLGGNSGRHNIRLVADLLQHHFKYGEFVIPRLFHTKRNTLRRVYQKPGLTSKPENSSHFHGLIYYPPQPRPREKKIHPVSYNEPTLD